MWLLGWKGPWSHGLDQAELRALNGPTELEILGCSLVPTPNRSALKELLPLGAVSLCPLDQSLQAPCKEVESGNMEISDICIPHFSPVIPSPPAPIPLNSPDRFSW
ncbi:hypothetical protein H920_13573 [Fukomys damarensis]|uniref:Uncharacterized protein n=1 Tax=Fukomys damarensis TaxID=885580 RepID=A0A091D3D8_FUKDA|nr:hypothetical protein H920_13573 [Fukomys damarensis]